MRTLRARQFTEDSGPLAHPVRPREYREINNFYTATVYEKGAEIIRMLKILLGEAAFAAGMELYFRAPRQRGRHDRGFPGLFQRCRGPGSDPIRALVRAGRHPACRPSRATMIRITTATASISRNRPPPTPGQAMKQPVVIPIALGLIGPHGEEVTGEAHGMAANGVFALSRISDSLTFENVPVAPIPSILRGFSAPVRVSLDLDDGALLTLVRHDSDAFNRWQAAQSVATRLMTRDGERKDMRAADALAEALDGFLADEARSDPAFAALMLSLPPESEIAQEIGADVDPDAIHQAREALKGHIAARLAPRLKNTARRPRIAGPLQPGRRLCRAPGPAQYRTRPSGDDRRRSASDG